MLPILGPGQRSREFLMKMVVAYVRHESFEPIRAELLRLGFPSLSTTEVKGTGHQAGITETYRGARLVNYVRPKVKIECAVSDEDVATVVEVMNRQAHTGAVGDGKIFILPIEQAYRSGLASRATALLTHPTIRDPPAMPAASCWWGPRRLLDVHPPRRTARRTTPPSYLVCPELWGGKDGTSPLQRGAGLQQTRLLEWARHKLNADW